MQLTILGNNGPFACAGGACSSYLISQGGKNVVIDMGPGSLSNLQKHVGLGQIDAIVLSHLHYDHVSDIFSLKYALGLMRARVGFDKKIDVFLPESPRNVFDEIAGDESFCIHVLSDGYSCDIFGMQAEFMRMTHPVESYALSLCAEGKRFVYSGDTTKNDRIAPFAAGADVYLADAGLLEKHSGGPHMTVREACESGALAKRTLLTHISPMYGADDLLREVKGEAAFVQISERYDI